MRCHLPRSYMFRNCLVFVTLMKMFTCCTCEAHFVANFQCKFLFDKKNNNNNNITLKYWRAFCLLWIQISCLLMCCVLVIIIPRAADCKLCFLLRSHDRSDRQMSQQFKFLKTDIYRWVEQCLKKGLYCCQIFSFDMHFSPSDFTNLQPGERKRATVMYLQHHQRNFWIMWQSPKLLKLPFMCTLKLFWSHGDVVKCIFI